MKRFLLLFALVTGLALPAGAQDTPSDDGESFTIRLIQNALSDAGRVVNISGFSGGIFSNATMDRLTIADEEGVWLEIDNAELDWNRSALLRGRLQINTLTAETITLTRLPEAIEDDTPAPEATGFRIPNLRVAIDIDDVAVDNLVLGEAVLGQAATLTLTGSASLENGGMDVDIKVDRLDAPGEFSIDASYDPADTTLAVDLTLREPSGGIASSLMDLPGDPAIDLTVSGTGPLDDYRAEIDLDTDGEDRLTGAVTLAANDEGGRDFTVELGGDITALVLQQYRDFFGTEVGLTAAGTVAADGALDLASFELSAAALDLQGTARLTGDFQPVAFDVTGRIQSEDGSRIELPFGNGISVASTTLDVQFDSAADTAVRGDFAVLGFQMPGYTAESLTLDLDGNIVTGADASFGADVTFAAAGLVAEDEAVGQALGEDITGSARIDWAGEGPVEIRGLDVTGDTYGLTGDIDLVPGEGTMELRADARMQAQDLSAFAPVSGMNLSGAADLALDLRADLVGGTFDLVAEGGTEDLSIGVAPLDPLINPVTRLKVDVSRTTEGLEIRDLTLANPEIEGSASGTMASSSGEIAYDVTLANAGIFTGTEAGPVSLEGRLEMRPDGLHIDGVGTGTDLITGIEQVDRLLAGGASFTYKAQIGEDGNTLENFRLSTEQFEVTAEGDITPGEIDVEVRTFLRNSALITGGPGAVAGAIGLNAQITQVPEGFRIEVRGGGRDIGIGQAMVDGLFRGETDLSLTLVVGEEITLEGLNLVTPHVSLFASGNLTEGQRALELSGQLDNSARFTGGTAGPLEFNATVTQQGASYALTLDATGTNIGIGNPVVDGLLTGTSRVTMRGTYDTGNGTLALSQFTFDGNAVEMSASGTVGAEAIDLRFNAQLDDLGRLESNLSGPLTVRGDIGRSGDTTRLDVQVQGAGGTTATVSGRILLPDGGVDLTINGSAPLALANPFLTPNSLTGLARFDLRMSGQPGLDALSGQVTVQDAQLVLPELQLALENLGGTINLSNGQANVDLRGTMGGGAITVSGPVGLSAPFNANLSTSIRNVRVERPGLFSSVLNGTVDVNGPITGGGLVSGTIGLSQNEVRIPSGGLGGVEAIPEITHLNESRPSYITRVRAGLVGDGSGSGSGGGSAGGGTSALRLDVLVRTDESIFIRGRGLDAELRGDIRLQGTLSDIRPVGTFDLVRGRLDILGKRLNLVEGTLSFEGSFDPVIRLVARNTTSDYTIDVIVEGSATSPDVTFTSTPDLPQDEVLAQLFFGRDLQSLSTFQAAQLAVAVATLTGRSNGGVVGSIRENFGLDDLDITQTDQGETAIRAGKYISENVYTDVEVTSGGESTISINLDVTDNIRASGRLSDEGDTSLGLYYEKDY